MRRSIAAPATIISGSDSGMIFLTLMAYLTDEHDEPNTVVYAGDNDTARHVDIDPPAVFTAGLLESTTIPNGYPITVRSVVPEDAVGMYGFPDYPIPVPVIAAILAGENMETHIEALVESDGFVTTLLLVTDIGLWVRYSGQWQRLVDVGNIDGLDTVEIEDIGVDLYDSADRAGRQLPVSAFQPTDTSYEVSSVNVADNATMTWQEPVTAGATAVNIGSQIHTARDLPAAIQAAADDESIRWYVERRARALGWEEPFPWV